MEITYQPSGAARCSTKERPKVPDVDYSRIVGYVTIGGNGLTPNSGALVPIYYKYSEEEKLTLINTGKYVPQNHTETPYNLNLFPTPSKEYMSSGTGNNVQMSKKYFN